MDKTKLLDRFAQDGEERILLSHLLDLCEQCQRRNIPIVSNFLSPQQQESAKALLAAAGVAEGFVFSGGYQGAERKKLCFLPDWADGAEEYDNVCLLRAEFYEAGSLTHRDFLGSLMGMGVAREKIGDLLVREKEADILLDASVEEFLFQSWDSAGRSHLQLRRLEREELIVPEPKIKVIRDTVASLRLDAVVSAGFSISRGKAAELIAAGRVQQNHKEIQKSDAPVKEGDVISARGLGKMEVAEVGGLSKKGRTGVILHRYQ